MKTTILVSRIMRVIETEGAVGEGSALAEEYSSAVSKVNSLLEAVLEAIDAKQVSDAVRMLEDDPRLLDEVGILDFGRLPDWDALCRRKRWTVPLRLDKTMLGRVLQLSESTEIVEPLLRRYRKAVLTNNNRLAVQSLGRLAQLDDSQNWKVNLVQAEELFQKQLAADFRSAMASGDNDAVERLAHDFAEMKWSDPPASRVTGEIRSYIAEQEAKRRDVEGGENLTILRRCQDENWNRPLALSMLQALDGLVSRGFRMPADAMEMVESCRRRCAQELEAEARECRWRELCERLHAAIQREDTAAIRDALSAPEFLDREPPPELIRQAQLVIRHEAEARKRKLLQIAVFAMAGLLSVLAVSGWWLRQKLFNDRCDGEAIKLAALQRGDHAVERLSESLRRLHADDPEVFADSRVNAFVAKLETMRAEMAVRTNEIALALCELRAMEDAGWTNGVDSVTGRIARVESIIAMDDDGLRSELLSVKAAWSDHCDAVAAAGRNAATKFEKALMAQIVSVSDRLNSELSSEALAGEVESCKASIAEWRRVHARYAPSLDVEVDEAAKGLAEAENRQRNLKSAIRAMKDAATAGDYLAARKSLVDFYSGYPFVKAIGEHPVMAQDAMAVVDGTSAGQQAYRESLSFGVNETTFKSFLADNVACLAEMPSYYSLYGIATRGGSSDYYFAVCKGKPQIKKPSYDSSFEIDGELLDFNRGEIVQQMSRKAAYGRPFYKPLPPSEEIKNIVDVSGRPNISFNQFEQELSKTVAEHLRVAGADDFLGTEVDVAGRRYEYTVDRYPAIRRVQLMQLYFTWLRDGLKVFPRKSSLSRWLDRLEALAQPVRLDGIPEDLTWTCMREARVRQRNAECARLLSQMAKQRFMDEYNACKLARGSLRRLISWNVQFVGCNSYDPADPRWIADNSAVIPVVDPDVKRDHPLYVLRKDGGKLALKRALVPCKNGTAWAVAPGMAKGLVAGDPLFQVVEDGRTIDAEARIADIFKALPEDVAKQFAPTVPLFDFERN